MSDDQQQPTPPQQPQAPMYPYFPISDDGLKRLHQEYGRLSHQSIELGVGQEKLGAAYQQMQAQALQSAQQAAPAEAADSEQPTAANEGGNGHQPTELIPAARKRKAG